MSQTNASAQPNLPLPTILAFGAVQGPVMAIAMFYGVFLPPNYAGLGLGLTAVAAAITFVRAVDIFFDPLLATVMDRTKTPIGRYRPWVVLGTPIVMLGVWKTLMPSGPVSQGYLILWLLVSFIGLSMMKLGTSAWSAVVATTYHDRARLFAWTSPIGILGIGALLMLPLFTDHKVAAGLTSSMPAIGVIFLIALPVTVAICAIFTPERLATASRKPTFSLRDYRLAIARPTMLRLIAADFLLALGIGVTGPLYLFYFHDAKGFSIPDVSLMLIFSVTAGIVGGLFWGGVAAKRVGKHRALQIACGSYAILQCILMAVPRVPAHYTFLDCLPTGVAMLAVGFCPTAFLILIRAMVADVVDEVRLELKQDLTSLLYSMVTSTTKLGGSIALAVVYPILAFVGYNPKEGAVNTPHAIFGLQMCFLFAPVILVMIGGTMFFGYKLDSKRHAEIGDALAELDAATPTEVMASVAPRREAPAAG